MTKATLPHIPWALGSKVADNLIGVSSKLRHFWEVASGLSGPAWGRGVQEKEHSSWLESG